MDKTYSIKWIMGEVRGYPPITEARVRRAALDLKISPPPNENQPLPKRDAERLVDAIREQLDEEQRAEEEKAKRAEKDLADQREKSAREKQQLVFTPNVIEARVVQSVEGGGYQLWAHDDFFDWWTDDRKVPPQEKKAAKRVLQQLAMRGEVSNPQPFRYGDGEGWSRAELRGKNVYLWYAKRSARPLRHFDALPDNLILLRCVRDHKEQERNKSFRQAPDAGKRDDWQPFTSAVVFETDTFDRGKTPYLPSQVEIAGFEAPIRVIKGAPGTGKSTTLWQTTFFSEASRVLYITHNERLKRRAEADFAAARPEGCDVICVTQLGLLQQLLSLFDENGALMLEKERASHNDGVRQLEDRLKGDHSARRNKVSMLSTRQLWALLYGDLLGRNIPRWLDPIDDLKGGDGIIATLDDFRAMHPEGEKHHERDSAQVRDVHVFFDGLLRPDNGVEENDEEDGSTQQRDRKRIQEELKRAPFLANAGGPYLARYLLDKIGDNGSTIWSKIGKAGESEDSEQRKNAQQLRRYLATEMILVDEVQDLTVVEVFLLCRLVRWIGEASGRCPSLVLAGDESQTLQPTGFRFSEAGNVARAILCGRDRKPEVFDLAENVRAPANLASLVNRARSLLAGLLLKEDRPAGAGNMRVEETEPGIICWLLHENKDDFSNLLSGTSEKKFSEFQLIYPGDTLPPDLPPEVMTAEEAKGLDFPHVGVIDVGRIWRSLQEFERQHKSAGGAKWFERASARSQADHLRVSLSRATRTLTLIDRDGGFEDVYQQLTDCIETDLKSEDTGTGVSGAMTLDQIRDDVLKPVDDNHANRIGRLLQQLPELLAKNPATALLRARQAHGLAGYGERSWVGPNEKQQIAAYRGAAAALLALHEIDSGPDDKTVNEHVNESSRWLQKAGKRGLSHAVHRLWNLAYGKGDKFAEALRDASQCRDTSEVHPVPELEWESIIRPIEKIAVERLVRFYAPSDPSREQGAGESASFWRSVIDAAGRLIGQGGRLDGGIDISALRMVAVHDMLACGDTMSALDFADSDPLLRAKCLEGSRDWRGAAQCYLDLGDRASAYRCFREAGEIEHAYNLREHSEDGSRRAIDAAQQVLNALDAVEGCWSDLKEMERDNLRKRARERLGLDADLAQRPRRKR